MMKLTLEDVEKFTTSYEVVKLLLAIIPNITRMYAVNHANLFEFSCIYIECSNEISQTELSDISKYILDSVCCNEEICAVYTTEFMLSADYEILCATNCNDLLLKNESLSLLNTIRLTESLSEKLLFLNSYLQAIRISGTGCVAFLEQLDSVDDFLLNLGEFAAKYVNCGKYIAYPYYKDLMKYKENLNQLSELLDLGLVVS